MPDPKIVHEGGGGSRWLRRVLRKAWDQALWIVPLSILASTLIERYT